VAVKKLVFAYLNESYPKTYRKLTKFGYDICGYNENSTDWIYVRNNMVTTIKHLFCINWITADDMINEWIDTLRVVDNSNLTTTERIQLSKLYNIDC
jgi:hypothetical protein